jgi:hypothetical protein
MVSDIPDILRSFAAIQLELRKLPMGTGDSEFSTSSPGDNSVTDYLNGLAGTFIGGQVLGSLLFHWNPELENVRVEVMRKEKIRKYGIYFEFPRWSMGRSHVSFDKLYKTKYASAGSDVCGPPLERRFGVTYSGLQPKNQVKLVLDAFKQCAKDAGTLLASVREQLASVLPAETLAARSPLHRWIFTLYDAAWNAPSDSPQAATKYIPLQKLNQFMRTDESVLYDPDYLRSTPWSEVERRLDPDGRGDYAHYKDYYASWCKELPEYYASRIDDVVQASVWTIDWIVNELQNGL